MIRSAMLQMRVTPVVKHASEQVFRRMGMSMTEAVELFLRRVIVDEKIPFDVIALDNEKLTRITDEAHMHVVASSRRTDRRRKDRRISRGGG